MPHSVAQDCRFYLDGIDLSGESNSVDLQLGINRVPDGPTFGQTVITDMPAARRWAVGASGLLTYGTGASEEALHTRWNRAVSIVTQSPDGIDGDVAYFGRAFQSEYKAGPGRVQDSVKWNWGGAAADQLIRGAIMKTKSTFNGTTLTGTAFQLGAVAAGQRLYAVFHVFANPSPSALTLRMQSDDSSGFGSPTNRIAELESGGLPIAVLYSVAGPITDTWWRTSISFTPDAVGAVLAVAAGII